MRLGIIARCDNTGLGNQTRELVKMLNPSKIMVIDFSSHNPIKQDPSIYDEYNTYRVDGIFTDEQAKEFLQDLDAVISCETFYNNNLPRIARAMNVKTYLQYNYELFGYLSDRTIALPDVLLSPSSWYFDKMNQKVGHLVNAIYHLPPPTTPELFDKAKEFNLSKDHKRILHIAGKPAAKDRNGTMDVIEMLRHSKADYELVVHTQVPLKINQQDSRLTIITDNIEERQDMYSGYDAMILPRRYAGLCLPMNEALLSGLPVFMTDISPNNKVLPEEWLVPSHDYGYIKTRTRVPMFQANIKQLAGTIDDYINSNGKLQQKERAYQIGYENFSPDVLSKKYEVVFNRSR
jgi:glycosyltransferase involved in cell wall biosynthesis